MLPFVILREPLGDREDPGIRILRREASKVSVPRKAEEAKC